MITRGNLARFVISALLVFGIIYFTVKYFTTAIDPDATECTPTTEAIIPVDTIHVKKNDTIIPEIFHPDTSRTPKRNKIK